MSIRESKSKKKSDDTFHASMMISQKGHKQIREGHWKDSTFTKVLDNVMPFLGLFEILDLNLVCSSWRDQVKSGFIWSEGFTAKFKEQFDDVKDLKKLRVYRYIRINEDITKTILAVLESQTLLREMVDYKVKNPTGSIPFLPEVRSMVMQGISSADYEHEKQLQERIAVLRNKLLGKHRKNATIQKNLLQIENKIGLLIAHQSSIYELERKSKSKQKALDIDAEIGEDYTKNQKKMDTYSNFLYLLRSEVKYLADVVDYVQSSEMKQFTETVILTLYGNAFSPLEEFLMMELFSKAIRNEFEGFSKSPSEFTQIDSVTPKMIISYTKRKQGKKYIKSVFTQALEDLFDENDDFGFSPAAKAPPNYEKMKDVVDIFFKLIIKSLAKLPYGLRLIGKKIYDYSKEMFPDVEEDTILSVVSYYIIYKFIGSAIASPDVYDVCDPTDIPTAVGAFLAFIAKSLQLIFIFTDAEDMTLVGLNGFFAKRHKKAREYLLNVIDVENADVALKVNRYNKLTGTSSPNIIISQREIVSLHELFADNASGLYENDDPIMEILKELGPVPVPVRPSENIRMELVNRIEVELEEEQEADELKQSTLRESVLLFQKLGGIPSGKSYLDILIKAKLEGEKNGRDDIVEDVDNIIEKLGQLEERGALVDDGYSDFLKEIFEEIEDIAQRIEELEKEIVRLEHALTEIIEQRSFMENKIAAFEVYLQALRRDSSESFKKKSKKFTYKELVKKGVIAESSIDESILKKLSFEISQTAIDMFQIKAKVKIPGLNVGGATDLALEDLLEAKENAEQFFDIENGLVLNVLSTLYVINSYFFSH